MGRRCRENRIPVCSDPIDEKHGIVLDFKQLVILDYKQISMRLLGGEW